MPKLQKVLKKRGLNQVAFKCPFLDTALQSVMKNFLKNDQDRTIIVE